MQRWEGEMGEQITLQNKGGDKKIRTDMDELGPALRYEIGGGSTRV